MGQFSKRLCTFVMNSPCICLCIQPVLAAAFRGSLACCLHHGMMGLQNLTIILVVCLLQVSE